MIPFRFLNKKWLLAVVGVGVLIFLVTIMIARGHGLSSKTFVKERIPKVIFLGIDAMDPKISLRLMQEGKLPNFQKLATQGGFTKISTVNPPQSPAVWSSIATGANPGQHGIFDFIRRNPKNYLPDISLASLGFPAKLFGIPIGKPRYEAVRGGIPFWNMLLKKNIPSTVIKFPVTFPPEKLLGNMLSGMGVPDIRGTQGTFTFYTTQSQKTEQLQGGRIIKLEEGEKIESQLIGPRGPQGNDTIVPLAITKDTQTKEVIINADGQSFRMKVGAWSPWYHIAFPITPFKKAPAICRFYLKSLSPFELYCTPMNFDPTDPLFPISYPDQYVKTLQQAIGDFYTLGMPHDTWALNEGRMTEDMFLAQTDMILEEEKAMIRYELQRFKQGVLSIVIVTLDRIQHMFWRYIDKESPLYRAEEAARYGGVIDQYYMEMDKLLGEILQKIDTSTLLLICSDHGFTNYRRSVHLNSWLRDNSFQTLKNGTQEGKPLFRDVDWNATKAYTVGFGAIYINLKGRETRGIVSEDKEKVENEIISKLSKMKDPKTGEEIVYKVYRSREIFSGDRSAESPDLLVTFKPGYRASWQSALGAAPQDWFEDNLKKWSGDHIVDPVFVPGSLFCNRKFNTSNNYSVYDIAPTILGEFDIETPETYEGKSIFK